MTKYGRPDSLAPASSTLAIAWVTHDRQRLPLGLESRDDLAGCALAAHDLERDLPADRGRLLRLVHDAHPALAEHLEDAVRADGFGMLRVAG